jgi:4-carboxymuconolactone decarboxylase
VRLVGLTKDQLDGPQLALYEDITTGPRSSGPQHFPLTDSGGALTGPFGIMLHQAALGRPLQDLGAAVRYRTSISDRLREIAILTVAAATDSDFERYAHERVARAVGLTDDEIAGLANGRFTPSDQREAAAYRLCDILIRHQLPVSDVEFLELSAELDNVAILELVVLVGYYRTLAQLLHVFDVGVPASADDSAHPDAG